MKSSYKNEYRNPGVHTISLKNDVPIIISTSKLSTEYNKREIN